MSSPCEYILSSFVSGGILESRSRFIKLLRVFHQSLESLLLFSNFFASLSVSVFLDLRFLLVTLFLTCYNVRKWQYYLFFYIYFRLSSSRFMLLFSQTGSDFRILIVLFGICLLASLVSCSVKFAA